MSSEDPNWPRASAWLRREAVSAAAPSFAVVGVPMNCSITPGNCERAPGAIREALQRYSLFDAETQTDLSSLVAFDHGDIDVEGATGVRFAECVRTLHAVSAGATATVFLGGDNAATRLGVHAIGVPLHRCGIITFDAHHDLRDLDRGLTNGNPVRALLRDGLEGENIVQIGIQPFTNSERYARIASEAGITIVTADAMRRDVDRVVINALGALASKTDAIYVDLDVDVLDRAFAPACPGARPGGLEPWMLRRAARICGAHPLVRAMDLVEVDPMKDIADLTCLAAASFLLAFASGVASRSVP